ncbi:hypothetical protein E4U43_004730 [Claviceps pusilla]|uniref:AT hook domain-containing protein n=1 Tax=Claviceps pusilla TaxID=123648 RepID=A0A9P7N5F2_9HYPO|nr:hypothetical protein E4U43_004730 [Claviceps pusilla]
MAPKIIADSDGDDSESESPSHVPCDNIERTESSPPGIDHQSMSTDPSFFNSIYNEQKDAAREQPTNGDVIDLAEESEATDYVSFDRGFERVEAQAPIEKSLWDVPSSPEIITMKPKRPAKRNAESNTRTKITRGLRRQLDDIGYRSPDDESTTWEISSKRRRTQPKTGTSGDLPSTIPIESDDSPSVKPKARTSARAKKHLSSDGITALSSPTQPLKSRSINIGSSGSATNVNTPREPFTPLVKLSSPERPRSSAPEGLDVVKKDMSPPPGSTSRAIEVDDEHSAAAEESEGDDAPYQDEPTSRPTTTRKPRGRPKKVADATATNEESVVSVKVKKKRGRPKKSDKMDENDDKKADVEGEPCADTKPSPEIASPVQEQQTDPKTASPSNLQDSKAIVTETETETEKKLPPAPKTPTSLAEKIEDSVKKDATSKKTDVAPNSSGRQLYRVGLSKRTKIAPLLKMIRK